MMRQRTTDAHCSLQTSRSAAEWNAADMISFSPRVDIVRSCCSLGEGDFFQYTVVPGDIKGVGGASSKPRKKNSSPGDKQNVFTTFSASWGDGGGGQHKGGGVDRRYHVGCPVGLVVGLEHYYGWSQRFKFWYVFVFF